MKKRGKIVALVGGQFGSEGKGVVAQAMAPEFDISVRTGAPNAGHSFVHSGVLYKMQSLPCGWVNPSMKLVIGPGALVNVKILNKEINAVQKVFPDIKSRIFVDEKAGVLEDRHHEEEGGVGGKLHNTMGSTGEGVGAARRDRMARDPNSFRRAADVPELKQYITDTVKMVDDCYWSGGSVMLEGAQGTGLSLIHGTWPHVTTNDTNAAQMAADAGVPPHHVTETVVVLRTYPIRVAGPSGPLPGELTWEQMSEKVGRQLKELTTVTRKPRRVAQWNEEVVKLSMRLNDPKYVVITFMDYLCPQDRGVKKYNKLSSKATDFVCYVERTFDTEVGMIGTGWDEETGWVYIDRREQC